MKNELLNKFNRLYKGCTGYAPEQYNCSSKCDDGIWRSWNEDKTKVLLGTSHLSYSHGNAVEYVYKDVKEW